MQLLLTSAAPSNIGQGGDTIIQTQCCVSPCAWVKLIFSVSRIVVFAQGPCSSSRSILQATRFVRGILEQGAMCSSRDDPICACHPCASHISVSFKKKPDYPSQIIRDILMQGPCSSIQSHAIFVQRPCNSVQKKKLRHPCAGAMRQCPAEDKASGLCTERGHLFSLSRSTPARNWHLRTSSRGFHRFAPHEHHGRPFWRETWR